MPQGQYDRAVLALSNEAFVRYCLRTYPLYASALRDKLRRRVPDRLALYALLRRMADQGLIVAQTSTAGGLLYALPGHAASEDS